MTDQNNLAFHPGPILPPSGYASLWDTRFSIKPQTYVPFGRSLGTGVELPMYWLTPNEGLMGF